MAIARSLNLPASLLFGLLGCFNANGNPAADEVGSESESDASSEGTTETTTDTTTDTTDTDTTETCTALGCPCDDSEAGCDPELVCLEGACAEPICGNARIEANEQCDDGNVVEGDGCDADCTYTEVLAIDSAYQHVCVLIEGGRVRCWGKNDLGQLGYGHTDDIGDDETPAAAGDVMLPEPGVALSLGASHSCVLLADDAIRCWGEGSCGKLGQGNVENIGDDEFPVSIIDVPFGGTAFEVDAGGSQTCARLDEGNLRCWGCGANGQLGYGNILDIGDNEPPANAGDVQVGATVITQATGIGHTCAILANGAIRCWGTGNSGQLGYGNTNSLGDDETPASAGDVPALPMGAPPTTHATALALGFMSCALFETGQVQCWGNNSSGELGQGNTTQIGDDEFPAGLPAIELGGIAVAISAGDNFVCALLESKAAICWGNNADGQLGYGHTMNVGDDETPASTGPIDLGGPVEQIDAGGTQACAILENNDVYCWGANFAGQLGVGHTMNIGDDEAPTAAGPVQIF